MTARRRAARVLLLVAGVTAAVVGVIVVAATLAFVAQDRRDHARVAAAKSALVASPFGPIEFARGGARGGSRAPEAPAVLVVHGSGGGHDQGQFIARAVLGERFEWIAPSRFGYLRSALPEGATFEQQAHAYAHLLDQLGIERVAVVALSHGGPSALLFALLHPQRVSSLTLLSCGVASAADATQAGASAKGDALATIFEHDWLYWAVRTFGRGQLQRLMGASDAVSAALTPAQRQLVDEVIETMAPVSLRSRGVRLDNRAAMPNERIAGIAAPTLVLHATDDALQLYRNAEYAAATIPGARLMSFERGGHLLIAVEQAAVQREVQQFILANAGAAPR